MWICIMSVYKSFILFALVRCKEKELGIYLEILTYKYAVIVILSSLLLSPSEWKNAISHHGWKQGIQIYLSFGRDLQFPRELGSNFNQRVSSVEASRQTSLRLPQFEWEWLLNFLTTHHRITRNHITLCPWTYFEIPNGMEQSMSTFRPLSSLTESRACYLQKKDRRHFLLNRFCGSKPM